MSDDLPVVISRSEAKAAGLKRFNLGTPCIHGHMSHRMVANGACYQCLLIQAAKRRLTNPEKDRDRSRKRRAENPEHVRALARARHAANPVPGRAATARWRAENLEYVAEYGALYRERNRAEINLKAAIRRAENPEAIAAAQKRWDDANRDVRAVNESNRRARIRACEGTHTADDVKRLCVAQHWKCANCGKSVKKKFHVDHIVPLVRGGGNGPDNLQILCQTCNQKKHAKDPIVWARENGRLV